MVRFKAYNSLCLQILTMIGRNAKQTTLSDKIAGLLTTAPASFDPEDDIYEETKAKVNKDESDEFEDNEEVALSKFRKQNVELLEDVDKRYEGKKGSRKSLRESDEWESEEEEAFGKEVSSGDEEDKDLVKKYKGNRKSLGESDEWETEDEGLSTDEGEALDGISGTQEVPSEDGEESDYSDGSPKEGSFKHMSDANEGTQAKGRAVRNQLHIWENLLEIRIQLQKCLVASNKLPQHDQFKHIKANSNLNQSRLETKKNVQKVLEQLLQLQTVCLKQYPETKPLLKSERTEQVKESDEEIPSDTDEDQPDTELDLPKKRQKLDFKEELTSRHNKYKPYYDSVIQKWNDKTRFSIGKNSNSSSILTHINFILNDKPKLIKRTQLKRTNYDIIGKDSTQNKVENSLEEYDSEIFDDDDFYHQLLRELIEFKSSDVTDPVQMSRQWITLQNLRSKMKKRVDTKATKGRRIRYAIHSKLVNYMAPIDNSTWTNEAKNELYNSLFGKT